MIDEVEELFNRELKQNTSILKFTGSYFICRYDWKKSHQNFIELEILLLPDHNGDMLSESTILYIKIRK